jgi:hypothetical protein
VYYAGLQHITHTTINAMSNAMKRTVGRISAVFIKYIYDNQGVMFLRKKEFL